MTLKVIPVKETRRDYEPQRWSWARSLPLVNNRLVMVSLRKGLLVKEHLNPRKRKE